MPGVNASSAAPMGASGAPGSAGWLNHVFNAGDLNANLAPNYQFQLGQGLGEITNQNAAAGGAIGGNALSGLQSYAQNYAGNAYQQAFQNYTSQQGNIYGRLGSLAQLGQASATGSASGAPLFAQGMSNTITGAGNALAAGQVGTANALGGGASNIANSYLLSNLYQNQGGGGSSYLNTPPLDQSVFAQG